MAQVTLTEKPLEVAIGSRVHVVCVKGGLLLAIALGVGPMALLAVVAIEQRAGTHGFRLPLEGVRSRVITSRHTLPVGG